MAAHPLAMGDSALATTCLFARTLAEKWPLQARIEATSDITIIPRIVGLRAGRGIASVATRISRASAPITRAYFA